MAGFIKAESLKDTLQELTKQGTDKENSQDLKTISETQYVQQDPDIEQLQQQELDSLLMPPPSLEESVAVAIQRPTAASLGLKESIEECMKVVKKHGRFG